MVLATATSSTPCAAWVDRSSYQGYLGLVNVGTKELKNRLSHYLRLVREGELVNVMDRGEVVAQLRPVRPARTLADDQLLRDLAQDGLVTRGRGGAVDFAPVRPRGHRRLSAMIIEDR